MRTIVNVELQSFLFVFRFRDLMRRNLLFIPFQCDLSRSGPSTRSRDYFSIHARRRGGEEPGSIISSLHRWIAHPRVELI